MKEIPRKIEKSILKPTERSTINNLLFIASFLSFVSQQEAIKEQKKIKGEINRNLSNSFNVFHLDIGTVIIKSKVCVFFFFVVYNRIYGKRKS